MRQRMSRLILYFAFIAVMAVGLANAAAGGLANAAAGGKLSTSPVLADGSFNPIPAIKSKLTDDPASLMRANNWRARYRAALDEARPAAGPRVYVYTFLDHTRDGIGLQFTYGWHLTGSAALECWTDARVSGAEPPRQYGLPVVDENSTATQNAPALDEWLAQALTDPAAASAQYIIAGSYDISPSNKATVLTIKMVDRKQPGAAVVLCTTPVENDKDFVRLAAGQRDAARAMAEKLIATRIVKRREAPKSAGQLSLEKELAWVARMLDSNDSWSIMDGIDQALALQSIFPGETLPIQAACYGTIELEWAYCDYADQNLFGMDYIMRAFALAQVAVAMDPKPSLSQLNWIEGTAGFGIDRKRLANAITGTDATRTCRELETYRRFVLGDRNGNLTAEQLAMVPDWQVLWIESEQTKFVGTSPARDYFNERVANWQTWPSHDLFFECAVTDQKNWNYETADKNRLINLKKTSVILTRETVASELAAILSAEKSGTSASEISEMTGVDAGLLQTGDYHALRAKFSSAFEKWEAPSPGHPAYGLLKWMDQQADSMAAEAKFSDAGTGFAGFEYTPLERVRLAQRRDHLGPFALELYEANRQKVFESAMDTASAYFSARPENAAAHAKQAACMVRWVEKGDDLLDQWLAARQNALRLFPLEQENYLDVARTYFYTDQQQVGLQYVREYLRQNPFSVRKNEKLGELFSRYGYHALAVEYLGEALKEMPKRYDIANERAWSLVQMGHAKDPAVRETFALPARELSGNSDFHAANLSYLFHWEQDMNAAREAALFYKECKPTSLGPIEWLVRIELKDGNTSAALRWLKQAPPPEQAKKRMYLANYYAALGDLYLDLKMPAEAEKMIGKAANVDEWASRVIDAMGRYYCETHDYDKAFAEYQREYERFGPSSELILSMTDCLYKKGMKDEAYRLLEDQVLKVRRGSTMVDLIPRMMEFYAERGEKDKAQGLMEFLLKSGTRTRMRISKTLESYKKLYPDEARQIWARIDTIMAGPMTIG